MLLTASPHCKRKSCFSQNPWRERWYFSFKTVQRAKSQQYSERGLSSQA